MPPNSLSPLLVSALALPLLAVGCAEGDDEQDTQPAFALPLPISDPGCTDCGKNGHVMMGSGIGHLNLDGLANDWGVKVVEFWHPSHLGTDLRMEVELDRLYGVDDATNLVELQGQQLVGAAIEIQLDPDTFYEVRILAVHRNWLYWTNPLQWIESYELHYDGPYPAPYTHPTTTLDQTPLCPQIADTWLGASKMDAAMFEGEIFHQEDLSIEDTLPGPGGWFTVACAHSAALKQLFTRRVKQSRPFASGIVDLAQRKAMKVAWTADYCGAGTTYTTTGVPLFVRDALGTIPTTHDASWTTLEAISMRYEAVWNENGAVCIHDWRRRQYDDENPEVHDEESIVAAQEQCERLDHDLPKCTDLIPSFPKGWQEHGKVLTAFPRANLTP
jgi:hypothetical protein